MVKKIVQDVVPPEQKTIRNIPIPSRRARTRTSTASAAPSQPTPQPSFESRRIDSRPAPSYEERSYDTSSLITPPRKRGPSKKGFWTIVTLCGLVLVYAVSFLFASADVTITPKTESTRINTALIAKKSVGEGGLGYDLVTVSKELGKTV